MQLNRRGAIALALVASLAFASRAEGAGEVTPRPDYGFEAVLPTTAGYDIYLRGYGPHAVEVDVESEELVTPYTTMTYKTGGRVGHDGIQADLGRFGRVDLHFSGQPKRFVTRFPYCTGNLRQVNRTGTMTGTVDFQPLAGTPKLELDSVEATVTNPGRGRCGPERQITFAGRGHRAAPEREPASTTFVARRQTPARTIDLYAILVVGELVDVAATSTRTFGKVVLETSVHAPEATRRPGKQAELSTTGPEVRPTGARLRAAAPFSGVGRFRKLPGRPPTWLGSLAVQIPGEGRLHLAGPGFRAEVCDYESTLLQRACEGMVGPPHTV